MPVTRVKYESKVDTSLRERRDAEASEISDDLQLELDDILSADEELTVGGQDLLSRGVKRSIDIFYALVFLILGIPWLIVCGLLMKREASGPFFYKQKRIGKNGRIVTVLKLRSMPIDAEENGPQLTPINGDKRLGPVGRFIRKAKIDELPQFWNVLIGEFSVVGPRAERPYFVEQFSREYPLFNLRHKIKPGLTGLAQINEKDALNMPHKLRYDLFYIQNRSLKLDLAILWSTAMYCFKCLFSGFRGETNGKSCEPPESECV